MDHEHGVAPGERDAFFFQGFCVILENGMDTKAFNWLRTSQSSPFCLARRCGWCRDQVRWPDWTSLHFTHVVFSMTPARSLIIVMICR